MPTPTTPPPFLPVRVLETCLYVDDLPRAVAFYTRLFGFPVLTRDERFCAFDAAGLGVLLLFRRGASRVPTALPGGTIPAHDGAGPVHLGLAIAAADLPAWEQRLSELGVAVAGRVTWPRGGTSLYFHDPDGHVLELATPGVWATY